MVGTTKPVVRALLLLSFVAANALSQAPAQRTTAPEGLPASLTNDQFWAIISGFSESGGTFPSDNFTSNELQIGQVASDLINRGRTGGAYLGVGPEQNFTYIVATRPEIVFIIDIRRQAVMQHLMYKAIFEMSNNRSEFIARLFSKPLQTPSPSDTLIRALWDLYAPVMADSMLYRVNAATIYNHLTRTRALPISSADSLMIAQVYSVFYRYGPSINYSARVGSTSGSNSSGATFLSLSLITDTSGVARSFLASEENFGVIKSLHSKNLFIPVVGNFGGPQALRKVGDYLREHRTFVNGTYVSNVEQYLFRPPTAGQPVWQEYYTSISFMPLDSQSVFIRPNSIRVNNSQVLRLVQGLQSVPSSPAPNRIVAPPPPPQPPIVPVIQQQNYLGSLRGTVTDSAGGTPVSNTTVSIVGTSASAQTNAVGQYSILNVPPGLYAIRAARVGYSAPVVADIRVAPGAPITVDFKMRVAPVALIAVAPNVTGGVAVANTGGGTGGPSLCPMLEFIGAFKAGRVQSYEHATRCVR